MTTHTHTSQVVIGTAGHIDHGKTSLIKALTGRDLDKLSEEKRRGITIELGFAFYGERIAFVDVPGHERLVKTMIAGASAMSAAMLVVAADDGVMPQTREHVSVLRSMAVTHGLAVVTKADLVEEEWLDLVVEEVRELLVDHGWPDDTPVVAVDSLSGRGIDEVKAVLDGIAERTPDPPRDDFFRMPVDRSFVIKGHGRIVTGSVWQGSVRSGEKLQLLPGGQDVRVRGLQAREQPVDEVRAGDRAALNLATDVEPERGQTLATPGRGVVTGFLDVHLTLDPEVRPLKHRARVRVHLGTAEVIARLLVPDRGVLVPGEAAAVRIALESELPAMVGDRGVLRFYSPMETLGGFIVRDPDPPDLHRPVDGHPLRLDDWTDDDLLSRFVRSRVLTSPEDLLTMLPLSRAALDTSIEEACAASRVTRLANGALLAWRDDWARFEQAAVERVIQHHDDEPNEPGLPSGTLGQDVLGVHNSPSALDALVRGLVDRGDLEEENGLLRRPGFAPSLSGKDAGDADRVHAALRSHGLTPPVPSALAEELGMTEARVRALLKALRNVDRTVILDDKVVIAVEAWEEAVAAVRGIDGPFTLSEVNKLLGISRKIGVPLLERLDKEGITRRDGDERVVVG